MSYAQATLLGASLDTEDDPFASSVLSLDELLLVHGGSSATSDSSTNGGPAGAADAPASAAEADWDNSSSYRDGAMQLAGAVGGIIAAGIGITTVPISFPLMLVGAAAAAFVGGFAAADAQIDMQNAQPDNS